MHLLSWPSFQYLRLTVSDVLNRQMGGFPAFHLWAETYPVSKMLCSVQHTRQWTSRNQVILKCQSSVKNESVLLNLRFPWLWLWKVWSSELQHHVVWRESNVLELSLPPTYAGFLPSLLFDPEDTSNMFLCNIGSSTAYMTLQPRKPYSSCKIFLLSCLPKLRVHALLRTAVLQ
jgi:hypothetical protein